MAFNFKHCLENEGLFKVRGSHVHCKCGNMSETVQDGVVVGAIIGSDMVCRIAAIPMTLSDLDGHSPNASFFV